MIPPSISVTYNGEFADVQFGCGRVKLHREQDHIYIVAEPGVKLQTEPISSEVVSISAHPIADTIYDDIDSAESEGLRMMVRAGRVEGIVIGFVLSFLAWAAIIAAIAYSRG